MCLIEKKRRTAEGRGIPILAGGYPYAGQPEWGYSLGAIQGYP